MKKEQLQYPPLPPAVTGRLLDWYNTHRRDLPWRESTDPYRVWVSEIMLQQTRVAVVLPYYRRWMEALPDVAALAAVEEDRLMKLWEGLGYYSRARNLQRAAKVVMEDHGGRFPDTFEGLRALPGIKKVFVRSGIRFDYLLCDKDDRFFRELVKYHISGQLKVAPEHVSDRVLACMGKPPHRVYQEFAKKYQRLNREEGMNQYLVPYLMSSHPGCTMKDAVELACYLHSIGHMPEQVQDFYPTPSTVSTCMYYTGLDPRTMEKVYVPRDPHEKAMQRALMQYRRPENRALVEEALRAAGREDLIGYGKECLIRPAGKKTRVSGYRAGRNAGVSASGRGEYRGTGGSGEGRKGAGVRFFENREQTGERFREDRERTEERFRKDRERRGERMGGSGGASGKKTIRNIHKKKRR